MKALLFIDIQQDFLPGGALPVPRGDEVVPFANALQRHFDLVIATQDWHPENHASFAANHPGRKVGDRIEIDGVEQILWPVHCVQNTPGAAFAPTLDTSRLDCVIQKGTDSRIDSYSAFFDNAHRKDTSLSAYLKEQGATHVYLLGLALDYCVKFSALDAAALGFWTFVIVDACRGIGAHPGDLPEALDAMKRAGVCLIQSQDV